jgi:hypothetical protein
MAAAHATPGRRSLSLRDSHVGTYSILLYKFRIAQHGKAAWLTDLDGRSRELPGLSRESAPIPFF